MAIIGFIVVTFAVLLVYNGLLLMKASVLFGNVICWVGAVLIIFGLVVGYFTLKYAPFTLTFN